MTPNSGHRRRPALRPLACGVMLALTTLPLSSLMAANLVDEDLTINEDHAVENWHLSAGSNLVVNGAATHNIMLMDTSTVQLNSATVTRIAGTQSAHALDLYGESSATATNTTFSGGGIYVAGNSRAELTGSSITLGADAPGMDTGAYSAWGISINSPGTLGKPTVVLDSTTVTVSDRLDEDDYNSGIGAYLSAGQLTMKNGSSIDAANVGVVLHNQNDLNHPLSLTLDASHIKSRRGAGIEVVAQGSGDNDVEITVANGSTIDAGDGNLLLVRSFRGLGSTGETNVSFVVDDSNLEGNIVFDDSDMQGLVNVTLQNNATLKGVFDNVSNAAIKTGSVWTLTGDSSVGRLVLSEEGTVNLGGNGTTFNTLTLDTFSGYGGTLIFNTVLEGDTSQTDKLHITGDAIGHANVQVKGVGGNGALTDKGIELITIDGQSGAQFELVGRAVGGIYEYNRLLQGTDGNWYLHSQEIKEENPDPEPEPDLCATDPSAPDCVTLPVEPIEPDLCAIDPSTPDCVTLPVEPGIEPDPEEPGKPAPVLRPEIGAYLANQAAMGQLLSHSARDRMAGVAASDGVRTWASTSHNEGRMDVTGKQRLDTRQSRLQVGADMGVFDGGNGRVGAMLSAGQADATSRSTVTGYRADATVEGGAVGMYANWSDKVTTLDASVQVGRFSNRVAGEGLEVERYKASAVQASVEAAHRFNVGQIGRMALSLQPEVQLTYTAVRMDTHLESTGTVVERDGGKGLSTRVGVRLEGEAAMAAGQFRPYVALHGIHDGRDNGMTFDGVTVEGALPRSRVELSAGGQVQFGSTLSGFGGISASQGEDGYRDLGAKVGLTYRW